MKKVIIFISTVTLLIAICFSGCYKSLYQYINDPVPGDEIFVYKSTQEYSTKESSSESITEIETTKPETTTNKNSNSDTTKPTEQKSAGQTTSKKVTTTQKSTTTKKQTTTKKVITTQKPTTTKKVTTTEDEWNCNVDGHSCKVGPIGWVNSFDGATDKALEYIASHDASGNFRVEQCLWCGKYTAEITLK